MEPLKNMFNKKAVTKISTEIKRCYPKFEDKKFKKDILLKLDSLELKERVELIADKLHQYLPKSYKQATKVIIKSLVKERLIDDIVCNDVSETGILGFNTWPLTTFIEKYGIEDYETSLNAMMELTKRFSAEFAIRPYIEKYDQQVFNDFKKWIKHPNKHVRRWLSEGTRPLLPWGIKVENIHQNISRNIPFLKALFLDKEEYVRRSVANHLNDISKLDSKLMLKTCKEFLVIDQSSETKWVVKHATRGLLKKGNKEALVLNGYVKMPKTEINTFKVLPKTIKEGDRLNLSFKFKSISQKTQKLLLEYIIYYPKKNGKLSPKPFRLKDFKMKKNEILDITKDIHFKKVSTRVHYPGVHKIEIQVNGEIMASSNFSLKK
jgi:3-methyladenine DNA glycosylase AlkC